jgi:outer membrane protein OmpA-like peptidoglycan-associated protein
VWLQVDDEPPLEHFVRFAQGRDRLVPEAEATVVALGSALGAWRMEVRGGYSPEGSLAANEALAQQRAEAVRAALLAAGVPDERIVVVPPAPPDPDHTVDEQRAVHLRLLPAETMP